MRSGPGPGAGPAPGRGPAPVCVPGPLSQYLHQNASNTLGLSVNHDEHRIINVFDQQPLCRQIVDATGVQLSSDVWSNELLNAAAGGNGNPDDNDIQNGSRNSANNVSMVEQLTEEERKLAEALVAVQFVQQSGRHPIINDLSHIAKVLNSSSERVNAESSNSLLEHSSKLYHTSIDAVELRNSDLTDVPGLQSLSPLKKIPDSIWFNNKSNLQYYIRNTKGIDEIENRVDLDVRHSINGAKLQNRKILPHKKRIPKKLKKHTPNILQKDDGNDDDDNLSADEVNEVSLSENGHHQSLVDASIQPDRALFICQICGEYYGNDQLQFFHHLKQHYEPHSTTIMIEGDINDLHHGTSPLGIDKIDDNMAENSQLPDSLVELSLEQSDASAQSKLVIYDAEKSLFNAAEKSNLFSSLDKNHQLYEDDIKHESILSNQMLNKGVLYTCEQCRKVFKKQKQYDLHLKEVHKIDDIGEFSEPEDLMEGIHVIVDVAENDEFLQSDLSSHSSAILIQNSMTNQEYILPHLIIENGQLHQEHIPSNKNWYHKEAGESSERIDDNSERLNINDNAVSSTDNNDMEVSGEGISCPMCNEPLRSKKDYSKHAQQCHIELKDEVLQQMMDNDVDVDVPDTENIPDNSNSDMSSIKEIALSSLKCPLCERQFKHKSSVTYHMLTHEGNRQYVCDECNKSFFSPGALKVHKRLHSGAKPHQCEHCDKKFRQWGDLKYHFISLHSNQKIHKCDYCGKDFARKYSLILHRRIHTGEKNYQCEFCSKTFRASSYLQNHRRIHTGEKPHECEICGKKFRMKGDLRRHFGVHVKAKLKNEKSNEEKKDSDDFSTDISENSLGKLIIPKNEMKEEKQETDDGDKDESSADVSERSSNSEKNNCVSSSNADSGEETKLSSNYQMENPNTICVWPVFIA